MSPLAKPSTTSRSWLHAAKPNAPKIQGHKEEAGGSCLGARRGSLQPWRTPPDHIVACHRPRVAADRGTKTLVPTHCVSWAPHAGTRGGSLVALVQPRGSEMWPRGGAASQCHTSQSSACSGALARKAPALGFCSKYSGCSPEPQHSCLDVRRLALPTLPRLDVARDGTQRRLWHSGQSLGSYLLAATFPFHLLWPLATAEGQGRGPTTWVCGRARRETERSRATGA